MILTNSSVNEGLAKISLVTAMGLYKFAITNTITYTVTAIGGDLVLGLGGADRRIGRRTIGETRSAEQGEGFGEGMCPLPYLNFFQFPHCNGSILSCHMKKIA